VLELAMSYELVEFATAVKPLVLEHLLRDFDEVVYLDPDTYQVSDMAELGPALDSGSGILLTPHYLEPAPSGNAFSEGHLLNVGVYNLGFCAVNQRAGDFLKWWWGHLRWECLHDPLAGLFVDQKWMDIGSVLFDATALRHYGYNVGIANLHERPIERDSDGLYIGTTKDRLRLFHFHAFDPERPEKLYTRVTTGGGRPPASNETLQSLSREYAEQVLNNREQIGRQPDYIYATDTTGRRITRHMRHAYRVSAAAGKGPLPSPFVPAEADEFELWRRKARTLAGKLVLSDLAKGTRIALPEEYGRLKRRFPRLTRTLRDRYVEDTGIWA